MVIVGSDTNDGAYEHTFGGPDVVLDVTGSVWSIDIESSPRDEEGWASCLRSRSTAFEAPAGLTITLTGYDGDIGAQLLPDVIRCVSRDPALNPPITPDPFDFSYPTD